MAQHLQALVCTSLTQIPLPCNTNTQKRRNIHCPGGIRTRISRTGAAADPRLRRRGKWDRQL